VKAKLFRQFSFLFAVALTSLPTVTHACDVCMGAKDPAIRPAVDGAIFFMLGIIGMMVTCVGFFMRYLAKRAHMPLPAHAEFNDLQPGKI
jgi:uncharacterized protein (DUF983 family)